VSITPSAVESNATAEGRVTLSREAPAEGAVVKLSSSLVDAARVPANVTVASGNTSATFPVTIATVSSAMTTVITASYLDTLQTATLTVKAPSLSPSFKVASKSPSGTDVCYLINDTGSVSCEFDARDSRGSPTEYRYTLIAAGNTFNWATSSPVATPQTTCSLFKDVSLKTTRELDVSLLVARNGDVSAEAARKKVRLTTLTFFCSADGRECKTFCGVRLD
jgi:hypothetical protein